MSQSEFTKDDIADFLAGSNPFNKGVKFECGYNEDHVSIIYYNGDKKRIMRQPFYPFVWCKQNTAQQLYQGNRAMTKAKMAEYGIKCKALRVANTAGEVPERMEKGYRLMFYATKPMSNAKFREFFDKGGRPINPKKGSPLEDAREYISVAPVEQFMITTGMRQFKGFDDYDNLKRMSWDIETEGLDPYICIITKIGIRTNHGFERIISIRGEGEERRRREIEAIAEMLQIVKDEKPDVIFGHNTENFDWNFIEVRLKLAGAELLDFTRPYTPLGKGIYKAKQAKVLKLGGEMEYYKPTIMWGTHITDSLHAVRRAQALNSNIKKADLKYISKFLKINKPNRVYIPGKMINDLDMDESASYLFNDINGDWVKINDKTFTKTFTNENGEEVIRWIPNPDGKSYHNNQNGGDYVITTGVYIVERYLLDDIFEGDKVELNYNRTNYQIAKLLPVSFDKVCTMGTAAIWKYIMLAWSYEHDLAIPELTPRTKFTGGLSRLLVTGYAPRVVKLDYNSLYPSIILTYGIRTPIDITDAMSLLLDYILTTREKYKGDKKKWEKEMEKYEELIENETDPAKLEEYKLKYTEAESYFNIFDGMQAAVKVIGNGFFGSYGAGPVFPHSDCVCAEETTCTGRQCLRLMISHFTNLGYKPLVGDSFTGDTPLLVRYHARPWIDIIPIEKLFDEKGMHRDTLKREYDVSNKPYDVLSRNGWQSVKYIYRHATNKPIYRVSDGERNMSIDVTQDHSLFNDKQEKIKPTDVAENTKLEYYQPTDIYCDFNTLDLNNKEIARVFEIFTTKGTIAVEMLNATIKAKELFLKKIKELGITELTSKSEQAKLQFIENCCRQNSGDNK